MMIRTINRSRVVLLLVVSATGVTAGVATLLLIGDSHQRYTLRSPEAAVVRAAPVDPGGLSPAASGDPRISWSEVSPGTVSNLVGGESSVWFSVTNIDSESSTIFEFQPRTGQSKPLAELKGVTIGALQSVGGRVGAGTDQSIVLVNPDGTVAELKLPAIKPLRDSTSQDGLVATMAAVGSKLYVARWNSGDLDVVETTGGLTYVDSLPLPNNMPPPRLLKALSDGRLLVSAPFAFHDLSPQAAVLDLKRGAVQPLGELTPNSAVEIGGALVATQTSAKALVSIVPGSSPTQAQSKLPLTGADDKIVAQNASLWAAPARATSLYRLEPDGNVDQYLLPTFIGATSVPMGADPSKAVIKFAPNISSIVSTGDGFVVFSAVAGPTRLGVVPPQ